MGRIRNALATAAIGAAIAAQAAPAQTPVSQPNPPAGAPPAPPTSGTLNTGTAGSATIEAGSTITAPPPKPHPHPTPHPEPDGGVGATKHPSPDTVPPDTPPNGPALDAPVPLDIPAVPTTACPTAAAPAALIPIYEDASDAYGLGPQGPGILAAINQIETNFGELNHVTSYAGAIGWMQFMPGTWATYGVDADGNGVADPYDPDDAIFAAARYLSAAGMPEDTAGAIFAYNHADWYVAQVMANAACFGGGGAAGAFSLSPQLPVLACAPAPAWRDRVPSSYLDAFEEAAARYSLGRRGVWALAAIARLESNFGRDLSNAEMRRLGPLGIDRREWKAYAVDGDGDGRISHSSVRDSAATVARMIWSRGDLRAGVFSHNQAEWYVQEVLTDAREIGGRCKVHTVAWPILVPDLATAPINWANLTLSNSLEQHDLDSGAIDPRIVGLIGAITQRHTLTITALRSDHSMLTSGGNVSNHYYGRAMDIAVVDGVSCTDVDPSAPCGVLARSLSLLPPPAHPTELIYCFDVDGPGPAFALPDHCDHVHVGFDG
jgi:hypothetical protein